MCENSYNLCSTLHISDQKILHDFAILRMSKMDSLPEDNHDLLNLYNSTVGDLVEFYNHYEFGK